MKKIISLNLCIVMILLAAFAALPVSASESRAFKISVGDESFVSGSDASGSGWSYDPSKNSLTLDGYSGGPIVTSGDLAIYSKGTVVIDGSSSAISEKELCGIYVGGHLDLDVSGIMTINGSTAAAHVGAGIFASSAKIKTTSASTLTVTGGAGAHAIRGGRITLETRGLLTAVGGDGCAAMYFTEALSVNNGTSASFREGSGAAHAITYLSGAASTVASSVGMTFPSGNSTVVFSSKAVKYGDVNGDNEINSKDAVLLAQYLAEWDVTIIEENADVNLSGSITVSDAVLLAQYLAEWNVTLG